MCQTIRPLRGAAFAALALLSLAYRALGGEAALPQPFTGDRLSQTSQGADKRRVVRVTRHELSSTAQFKVGIIEARRHRCTK